ncbi:MAG: cytochrome c oxidase assembly protein [Candidatus Promineifilaceae bacterium]
MALAYARAVYARDYAAAWEFISSRDKAMKSRQTHLAENVSFAGRQQDLAYALAGWIQFTESKIQMDGDQAIVTTQIKTPNGNQPAVYAILREAREEDKRTAAERPALSDRLQRLYAVGRIEILEGEETFTLAREWMGWRIVMGWADAVVVKLTAEVSPDLPWEFYPLQAEVRALPGETLLATYRATNRADRPITGKAKHSLLPETAEAYFDIIQCFCFIQQTLAPGESVDLKLVFRIDEDAPAEVRQVENKYVFYPLASFPGE